MMGKVSLILMMDTMMMDTMMMDTMMMMIKVKMLITIIKSTMIMIKRLQ